MLGRKTVFSLLIFGTLVTLVFFHEQIYLKNGIFIIKNIIYQQEATVKQTNTAKILNVGKILILTIADGHFWYKELVRKNRQNYCTKHGYKLKIIEKLDKNNFGININWHKILEFNKLVESNAPFDWVWLADLDMFIMNNTIKLDDIIRSRMFSKHQEFSNQTNTTLSLETVASNLDIIVARDNHNINFGSVLVRLHSNFTTKLFKAMWNKRWDSSITQQNEQTVFMYFLKAWKEEFDTHMVLVPQSTFNSFPWDTDGHYKYKQGEFVVHFAGAQKPAMTNFTEQLYLQEPNLKKIAINYMPLWRKILRYLVNKIFTLTANILS
jgi:hypothetical protein